MSDAAFRIVLSPAILSFVQIREGKMPKRYPPHDPRLLAYLNQHAVTKILEGMIAIDEEAINLPGLVRPVGPLGRHGRREPHRAASRISRKESPGPSSSVRGARVGSAGKRRQAKAQ
jgi:hypothetical protein